MKNPLHFLDREYDGMPLIWWVLAMCVPVGLLLGLVTVLVMWLLGI